MKLLRILLSLYLIIPALSAFGQSEGFSQAELDSISRTYENLDEFVFEVKKEVVKSDGATLTYDMDADDSSKGQSVLDALKKVPMVSVDGQDNIYIKGSQDFKIYVNGKEDPMMTANASRILKAMPSEAVSKIEVITEPGAKYDAEGVGGILNLVTERKQRKDGYTGTVGLTASSQNLGANIYGRMKYDKITADASVNYFDNALQKQSQFNNIELIDYSSDINYRNTDEMRQKIKFNYLGANLNLSWEPTDHDLFTIGGNLTRVAADVDHLDYLTTMYSRGGDVQWKRLQMIGGSMNNLGASGNTSYRRLFGDQGNSLTLAYRFNYGYNPFRLNYENSTEIGEISLPAFQKSNNITYQREHTATVDYVNPFADGKHKLELGLKGIFRRNNQITEQFAGEHEDALLPITDDMGSTKQLQNIYAAYASYNGTFGNVALTAGLRYEHTYMGLDFPLGNYDNFRRHLNDLVPNAAATYMFGPAANLRLAYQMRINRPSINQLNPTEFRMTQNIVQVGNPNLESEHYNNISLTYSNFGRVLGGNIGISLHQSNNTIENYVYYIDGVTYNSYGNYGKNRKAELNGFLNWNINNKMSFSINGAVDFTDIKSGDGKLGNHGWNGRYGGNYNYTGPWKVKYSLYGGQSTGMVRLQGRFYGWYYYGLGVSKSFLKDDALTVSINASNFLTKYTSFKTKTWTDTTYSSSRFKNRSWNVGISLSWNFGHLSDQVKKTNANLEYNDTKDTGNGTSNTNVATPATGIGL